MTSCHFRRFTLVDEWYNPDSWDTWQHRYRFADHLRKIGRKTGWILVILMVVFGLATFALC